MLRVLDLFSGIGGFSLGLERTGGFKTVAFCEIEPFCRRVLAKHWPEVPCYDDVRTLTANRLAADGIAVDVICGGFPCQDISVAGYGAGIEGARSGLWSEYARVIRELRPRYVIVENVAALLGRGLDKVLGDLAEIGLDAEWHCIPASAIGAPHERDRLWLVAYPNDGQRVGQEQPLRSRRNAARSRGQALANSDRMSGAQQQRHELRICRPQDVETQYLRSRSQADGNWSSEPGVGRVAHGVPGRVDRLRALGNAVVPQIPELIGRAILASSAPSLPMLRGARHG
jgi:DNA (cytosine-5)-methyltransferase 1